ncbi:MAG TPA: hypothetical protein PK095_04440 [Myxococcota bacterium]|nr:hypothetical protein [Myxococcota bacterium]
MALDFALTDLEVVSQPADAFEVEIVGVSEAFASLRPPSEQVEACRGSGTFATFSVDCLLPLNTALVGAEVEVRRAPGHDPAWPAVGELQILNATRRSSVPLRLGPPEPRIAYRDLTMPCPDEEGRRILVMQVENIGSAPLEVVRVRGMASNSDAARRWSVGGTSLELESSHVWREAPMAFTLAPMAPITLEVTAEAEGPLGVVVLAFVDEAGQSWGSRLNPFFVISDWCL